jgi:hypothetical protein
MSLPPSLVDELSEHLDRFAGSTYVFPGAEDGRSTRRTGGSFVGDQRLRWRDSRRSGRMTSRTRGSRSSLRPGSIQARSQGEQVTRALHLPMTDMAISCQKSTSRQERSSTHLRCVVRAQ